MTKATPSWLWCVYIYVKSRCLSGRKLTVTTDGRSSDCELLCCQAPTRCFLPARFASFASFASLASGHRQMNPRSHEAGRPMRPRPRLSNECLLISYARLSCSSRFALSSNTHTLASSRLRHYADSGESKSDRWSSSFLHRQRTQPPHVLTCTLTRTLTCRTRLVYFVPLVGALLVRHTRSTST